MYSRSHYQLKGTSEKTKSFPPNIGKWERKCRWRRKTCLEKSAWVKTKTIEWNVAGGRLLEYFIHSLIFRWLLSFPREAEVWSLRSSDIFTFFLLQFGDHNKIHWGGDWGSLLMMVLMPDCPDLGTGFSRKINFNLVYFLIILITFGNFSIKFFVYFKWQTINNILENQKLSIL